MKLLSRDFTRKEKIMILILSLILLGLCYYRFIDVPIKEALQESENKKIEIQAEYDTVTQKADNLKRIQEDLDSMKQRGDTSYMPSYNASSKEIAFLNDVLASSVQYNISFSQVTRTGDQIRRAFDLQFTVKDVKTSSKLIKELSTGPYRCSIQNITCSSQEGTMNQGVVGVSLSAIFYETMVDGKEDAGLPTDTDAQDGAEQDTSTQTQP